MAKKIIVGVDNGIAWEWKLPNDITLYGGRTSKPHKGFDDVYLDVFFEDECMGELTKGMCHQLFDVILYPPGSQPSPETAIPGLKERIREANERYSDDPYEIPRYDI